MNRKSICIFFCPLLLLFWATITFAVEIQIPTRSGTPGDTVEVPVLIDEIDNLAGIKLVMTYDAGILLFKKAEKTQHTASLMHIVNDKKPGTLIIVMAGARGIKGTEMPLVVLTFQVKPEVETPGSTDFKITDVQLMSDKLKDIKATVKTDPLKIVAGEQAEPAPNSDGPCESPAPSPNPAQPD